MKYADAVTDEKEGPGHDLLPTSSEGPDNEKTCGFLKNWRDRKHRLKLIHSLSVVISFITLGLNAGQSGPTFLDLQLITGVDIERASAFFTGLAVGYLTGSALAGILYIKVNRHIVLFLSTLCMGIAAILTPWCSIYELMVFIRFANGVFHGSLNTAGNTKLMRLWGNEGRVLMQLLHFSFACGGIISPLYSQPFLAHTSNGTRVVSSWSTNTSAVFNTSQIQMEEDTVVYYAFIITGVCAITASLPYFVFFCRDMMRKEKETKSTLNEEVHQRKLPNLTFIVLLGLLCLFFVLYSCVEGTFASFLVTFLVREFPSVTKSDGAYVMAIFWASLAVSRFLMIFVAILLSSAQLLYLCCILMLVTFISFLASAFLGSTVSLTVFSACAGLSMSAVFPAGFSWSESELLRITGRVSSCIVVFASLGAMINPLILGYLMKESTNMWFCYLLLGQTVAMCLVFIILLYFNRYYVNKRYGRLNDSQLEMSVSADVVQKLDTGKPLDVPPVKNESSDLGPYDV